MEYCDYFFFESVLYAPNALCSNWPSISSLTNEPEVILTMILISLFFFLSFFDIGRQLKELSIHFPTYSTYVGLQGAGAYPSL